ncbi:MAG: hypothetical protein ACE5GE_00105 [Phycisphaerae bacterium]
MNEWQRSFLKKLESAKQQWLHRFEKFTAESIDPVFSSFEEFAIECGFQVTHPRSESSHRIFKFALTENGYALITFHMVGLEEIEVSSEYFVPGMANIAPHNQSANLCDAGKAWTEAQFQSSLDRFIKYFAEAGGAVSQPAPALAGAK